MSLWGFTNIFLSLVYSNVWNFFRGYATDEDEEDLLDDVIDGGINDAEGDDLDDRAARFLLYWTTITKVSVSWQFGEST